MRLFIKCFIAMVIFSWTGLIKTKSILTGCLFSKRSSGNDRTERIKKKRTVFLFLILATFAISLFQSCAALVCGGACGAVGGGTLLLNQSKTPPFPTSTPEAENPK